MALSLFFRGLVLGLAIAAPVGPIGVLCIRQTLTHGRWIGFVSGLGAATADGLYGSIAGFGLSALSNLLTGQIHLLKLIGGIFLCYLGITTLLTKQKVRLEEANNEETNSDDSTTLSKQQSRVPRKYMALRAYLSTLVLTLTNPATILSFTAIFAGLDIISTDHHYHSALTLVSGVFLGSALWWLTLSSGIFLLKKRFTLMSMVWVNRISGSIITTFGILAIFS